MTNKWIAFDRRETKDKSVALDTLGLESRRTPLVCTQLLFPRTVTTATCIIYACLVMRRINNTAVLYTVAVKSNSKK